MPLRVISSSVDAAGFAGVTASYTDRSTKFTERSFWFVAFDNTFCVFYCCRFIWSI